MTTDVFTAWDDFCESLKDLGRWVEDRSAIGDELDQAEGIRYLTRLLRGGLEANMESAGPAHPRIATIPFNVKIGVDNPDALYQSASVSGDHRYRIRGNRGSVHYLSIISYGGDFGSGADALGRHGRLTDDELIVDENGDFEATLSVEPADGNWLQLQPGGAILVIRQFFLDRDSERPAQLDIEVLDEVDPPPSLTGEQVVHHLAATIDFVGGTMQRFMDQILEWREHRPNTLDFNNAPRGGMGDNLQKFRHGYFALAEDEALVIRVTPPPCFYWNVQVDNLWQESLDYRHHQITVNKHSARYEDDGSVVVVIAHEDPGVGNWLTTAGHRHGGFGWRWNQPEFDVAPEVTVEKLADLRAKGA